MFRWPYNRILKINLELDIHSSGSNLLANSAGDGVTLDWV